ncbi:hypothetical protein LCM10_05330 [Rossellomorea aquimaris]|uniref:hypothetical protein n=1 Tax=Rossellomorea aquimaris TaxID=189382 RepID=UPI001CD5F46F|nr:hypothetical protein [Rossellomorea aquimaris]MCA1054401.1 hypothetical protein [Rossellomorea aquimaris]
MMIRNKWAVVGAGVLFATCMLLFFPFPDQYETRAEFMSIPVMDQDGYVPLGVTGSILLLAAFGLLGIGLERYRVRAILIAAFAYLLLPNGLIWMYQETVARGVYAVSYDGEGSCEFETASEDEMDAKCSVTLHNHSNERMTVEVEFLDSYFPDEDTPKESLMNENGPYVITLEPKQEQPIELVEVLDLAGVRKHIDGGSFNQVHIRLSDGERIRDL